jgi:hypothetical protein
VTAYRVRVLQLATTEGRDEETEEAEAGALLEAETGAEIHGLHEMVRSYLEALNKS